MRVLLSAFLELDFQTFIGGHGYDVGAAPRRESSGDDGGGGIGTGPIVAVVVLTLVTAGLLVWLSPARNTAKVKTIGRGALIVVVITLPLIVWAGSSGGEDDREGLIVERATSRTGAPEFIVSLADAKMNKLATNNGNRSVRVECRGDEGEVVLDAKQKWPFINEPGYDYPHAHQPASREQLQEADRCRLRGPRVPLEADVEGALTG